MFQDHHCRCSRREFLRHGVSAALAGAVSLRPEAVAAGKAVSFGPLIWRRRCRKNPNEQIQVACIGLGQRGRQHWQGFESTPGAVVVALCDVDLTVLTSQAEEFQYRTGRNVRLEQDYRRLVEDPAIDAVSVATCNHTHALITIAALQAGKHVYVEKPCSHNMWEGQQLVRAAAKYGRICLHGLQARTSPAVQEAICRLQQGLIGEVQAARIRAILPGPPPAPTPDEPTPPGVAYDLWLGPAPNRPFNRNRFHRYWRWQPEYGNGPLANQALHLVDLARWGLAVGWPRWIRPSRCPSKLMEPVFWPTGPEQWVIEFPEGKRILVELWPSGFRGTRPAAPAFPEAVTFYGTDGLMEVDWTGYRTWLGRARSAGPSAQAASQEFKQFIRAVQTEAIPAQGPDIREGHLSCGLMHLVNIARHVGRAIQFNPATETILHNPEAEQLCGRQYRPPFLLPEIA